MSRPIRLFVGTLMAAVAVLPLPAAGAAAETEISTGATQFVPALSQISADSGVAWVNKEAANYPVLIGNHNIVPDEVTGQILGNQPFPTSSSLIAPGGRWACEATAGGPTCTGIDGSTVQLSPGRYAYMCGLHPNHMRGILVVS